MRATLPDGGLLSNQAAEMFMGVFDQEVAERIADGPGWAFGKRLAACSATARAPWRRCRHPRRVGGVMAGRRPVDGVITSRFGHRSDPFHGGHRMHDGMDIAADHGSPVRAVRDERVLAGRRGGYGNVVVVDHGDGAGPQPHCDSSTSAGQRVEAGSVVAVGDTGRATGAHLHFEVRVDGEAVDPSHALRWR